MNNPPGESAIETILEGLKNGHIPQGGALQLRREANLSLGARDSAATGRRVAPLRGLNNPLGAELNHPGSEGWKGGRTNIRGTGIHPGEGV